MKRRASKGREGPEYLVKWIGFDETQNTWEPEANLEGNLYLVQFKAKAGKTETSTDTWHTCTYFRSNRKSTVIFLTSRT